MVPPCDPWRMKQPQCCCQFWAVQSNSSASHWDYEWVFPNAKARHQTECAQCLLLLQTDIVNERQFHECHDNFPRDHCANLPEIQTMLGPPRHPLFYHKHSVLRSIRYHQRLMSPCKTHCHYPKIDAQLHPIRAPDPWNSANQDRSLQQRQSYLKAKKYHLLRIAHRSLLTKPLGLAES